GYPALDGQVYVLVLLAERKAAVVELALHGGQRLHQGVTVAGLDDAALREHPHVGARLGDVVGRQAPVEGQRGVQPPEQLVLALRGHVGDHAMPENHRKYGRDDEAGRAHAPRLPARELIAAQRGATVSLAPELLSRPPARLHMFLTYPGAVP